MGVTRSVLLVTLFLFSCVMVSAQNDLIGSNFETSCEGTSCTTIVYSYEKYFYDESSHDWEQIDESWEDCSTNETKQFCSQDYYFEATANSEGEVTADDHDNTLSLRLTDFLDQNLTFNPEENDNVITYPDIIYNVDLRYQYLPRKLKEEIVINEPLENIPEEDFQITFTKSGEGNFVLANSIICDDNLVCEEIPTDVEDNQIILTIPVAFLNNPETEYPVIIDPTVELNDSAISWNGYVHNNSGTYNRFDDPTQISLASDKRGDIDWDISSIPDSASITNLTLELFVSAASIPYNISIMEMEGDSSTYANTTGSCQGNCNFWADMGNGTEYNQSKIIVKSAFNNFTLTNGAIDDFEAALATNFFSTGMITDYLGTTTVSAKDNSNVGQRPRLIITHSYELHNLSYDANGNMIQGFGKYMEYNGFNQLVKVRQDNSTGAVLAQYWYDQNGERVKKISYRSGNVSDNETTYYISDEFVQVRNASGIFNFTYYYSNDKLVAMKNWDGKKLFYHPDHLDSTTLVTNESGAISEEEFYLPFGETYEGSDDSRYLYTGKELDKDTELYYYGARYYDARFSHFIQPDPIISQIYDPQNLNRYAYVLNNPYKYTDPTGNEAVLFGIQGHGGIFGILGIGSFGLAVVYNGGSDLRLDPYYSTGGGGLFNFASVGISYSQSFIPGAKSLSDIEGESTDFSFGVGEGPSLGGAIGYNTGSEMSIAGQKPSSYTAEVGLVGRAGLPYSGTVTKTQTNVIHPIEFISSLFAQSKESKEESKNAPAMKSSGYSSQQSPQLNNGQKNSSSNKHKYWRNFINRLFGSKTKK